MMLLDKEGWEIIVVWECELKKNKEKETLANLPGKIVS
jgi:G:T-mismatch repair DNA endonuclease (very short patch repair protein)